MVLQSSMAVYSENTVNSEQFKNHPHPHLLPSREKELVKNNSIKQTQDFSLAPLWERQGEGRIFSSLPTAILAA